MHTILRLGPRPAALWRPVTAVAHRPVWRRYSAAMDKSDACLYVEPVLAADTGADTGIRIMHLNRPDTLNSLTTEMATAFKAALSQMWHDAKMRVLIVTGKGRAFSAGGDFGFIQDRIAGQHDDNVKVLEDFYRTFLNLRQLSVPTIAAINGAAVGGGMGLAMACDMRLAASSARLSFNFVKLGITPGMGASMVLPAAVGHQAACRMLLTGDLLSAHEALRMGVVLEVHDDQLLMGAALDLAGRIAVAAPAAVQATLSMLRQEQSPYDQAGAAAHREAAVQASFFHGPDLLEGLAAVKEKRAPVFGCPADHPQQQQQQ